MAKNVVLITGSNGGIGLATAKLFKEKGFCLSLSYHNNSERIRETFPDYECSDTIILNQSDITNETQVEQAVKRTIDKYGQIDVLINNAGITRDKTIAKMTMDMWSDVINVNLSGIYCVTKNVIPHMIQRESGLIINISSVVGENGNYGQCNYSASKAGVIGFTKSLAKEVAKKNVRVVAVAPGYIDTPMTSIIPDHIKSGIIENIPLRRFGEAREVAELLYFLASTQYITGSVIDINGGL